MKPLNRSIHTISLTRDSFNVGLPHVLRRHPASHRVVLLPLYRFLVFGLISVYAVLLVAILRWTLSSLFAYEGYGYFPISQTAMFLWTWCLAVLPALFLPIQIRRPSQFLIWILILIVYIPGILIPPYSLGYQTEYVPYQAVMFVCALLLCAVGLMPHLRLPGVRWSIRTYVIGLLIYSAVIMGWIISQVGLPTSIPTFADVYVQRASYGESITRPGPLAYLIAWQTSVINPLLLLIGLTKRKWIIVATGLGLNLLMYSLAGHKSHLLSSILVVGVYVLLGLAPRWRGILISVGTIVLISISTLLYSLGDFIYPVSIFVRRMIAVPGMLTGYYFDYFSDFGHTEKFGPLSFFLNPVTMELSTPNTIGLVYFGNPRTAANANFWADAFSALGYPGMILATLVLCIVLWLIDSLSITRPARLVTPLFVIAMYSLTNSALPTSLLTHGILFTVLMVLLYPVDHTEISSPEAGQLQDLSST